MRVLTITYTDMLSGAGVAALRLHRALRCAGIASRMEVMLKRSDVEDVGTIGSRLTFSLCAARQYATKLILRAAGAKEGETLSANMFRTGLHKTINRLSPDVVHFHWIGGEMIRIEEIAHIEVPIVWTLHDEWVSLGLEHYSQPPPEQFLADHPAHQARSTLFRSIDQWVRKRKLAAWAAARPQFVTPSAWLSECVRPHLPAGLPAIRTIPNPLPLDAFRPIDRAKARRQLGLPEHGHLIAFGAIKATQDPRKGYTLLRRALATIGEIGHRKPIDLLVFGNDDSVNEALPGFRCHFRGVSTDPEHLARLYSASDVFICPSLRENLPNMVAEALACGTPCVAFDIGGLPELIDDGDNGFLARPFDPEDLARCIEHALALPAPAARKAARRKAESMLSEATAAARYLAVYKELA